ncbi:MAG: hypothetical protein BGO98_18325 [Myxococcales bacterium 68-20]|nr:hypothetical protein [Myxococcales bacterium]OJY23889.1 MAG: hypothetical protein BGO98_18325 [Myxococcales bacterium 68-20]
MLFEWVVPAECPTEQEVVAHVTSLAGETLAAQPLRVRAHVARLDEGREGEPPHFRLELRVGSESAPPRVLESDTCGYLADAAAFIVALDLQSYADVEATVPPPPPAPPPPPVAPTKPRRTRRVSVPRAPKPEIHGGLGADLRIDHASLPALGGGGSVFGFVEYQSVRADLGAALWPPRHAMVPGGGASITLRAVDLRACWSPFSWGGACARAEVGALRAAGIAIAQPATSDGLWLAGLVGLTAQPIAWGPLRVRMTAELGAPLRYPTVTIEELGRVFRPGTPIVRLGMGLEAVLF